MPTAFREGGLRIIIYLDDHPPPHVHVIGDGEAKIALLNGVPKLIWQRGFKQADVKRAMNMIEVQYQELMQMWDSIHG
jgi:Domain of unknown function (DUF4160)